MKKYMMLFLCAAFLLSGCAQQTGIYFSEIDQEVIGEVYNPLASYFCSYLHYNDKIYTAALTYSTTEQSELPLDSALDETLTTVLGNHGLFWSEDGEELSEITNEGTVYQVKGYDESFRVAVYYEAEMPSQETYYYLMIFDHYNDISFSNGGELFEDLLHLDESASVKISRTSAEDAIDNSEEYEPAEDAIIEEFLTVVCESTDLTSLADREAELEQQDAAYTLSFYDSNGFVTDIMVYGEDYAVMEFYAGMGLVVGIDY